MLSELKYIQKEQMYSRTTNDAVTPQMAPKYCKKL